MADDFVTKVMDRVDEALTVIETVKKIPEYNSDLTVEMAMRTARLKVVLYDPKVDDHYIMEEEVEPNPLGTDNCMREGIETKPLPLLDIDNIDLMTAKSGTKSPLRTMKTMLPTGKGRHGIKFGASTQRVINKNKKRQTFGNIGRQASFAVAVGDLDDDERESLLDADFDENFEKMSNHSKTMSIRSGVSRAKQAL